MYDKCKMGIKQREQTALSIGKVEAEQPTPLTPFGIPINKHPIYVRLGTREKRLSRFPLTV